MRSLRLGARWASSALAVLLLASSLTCLTAACRTLCGGAPAAAALASGSAETTAAPETKLPPCHRPAAAGGATAPAGGCKVGSPCCAQWLNDHATLQMTDPDPLRTLLPTGATTDVATLATISLAFAIDPPGLEYVEDSEDLAPPVPRAATGTRGPPRVALAA